MVAQIIEAKSNAKPGIKATPWVRLGGRISRKFVTVVRAAFPEQALRTCGSLAPPNRGYRAFALAYTLNRNSITSPS
jgi:hypothetical protein